MTAKDDYLAAAGSHPDVGEFDTPRKTNRTTSNRIMTFVVIALVLLGTLYFVLQLLPT